MWTSGFDHPRNHLCFVDMFFETVQRWLVRRILANVPLSCRHYLGRTGDWHKDPESGLTKAPLGEPFCSNWILYTLLFFPQFEDQSSNLRWLINTLNESHLSHVQACLKIISLYTTKRGNHCVRPKFAGLIQLSSTWFANAVDCSDCCSADAEQRVVKRRVHYHLVAWPP